MPANKTDEALLKMAGQIGELVGSTQAFQQATLQHQESTVAGLNRLNDELDSLAKELDRKHQENVKAINEHHQDNAELLAAHKEQDAVNFAKIFKYMNYISGAVGAIVILWSIFKLVLPFVLKIKLGE